MFRGKRKLGGRVNDFGINIYAQTLQRVCTECGGEYTIGEYMQASSDYFARPSNYRAGCETYCLACWLGVGPNDFPQETVGLEGEDELQTEPQEILAIGDVRVESGGWPENETYGPLVRGDLLQGLRSFLDHGANLAIMPIARIHLDRTVLFPSGMTFYPPGLADLGGVNLVPNSDKRGSLSERCSAASGITRATLDDHALVVLPCRFDWKEFRRSSHRSHLDFIRSLSEEVDRRCMNYARYRFAAWSRLTTFHLMQAK